MKLKKELQENNNNLSDNKCTQTYLTICCNYMLRSHLNGFFQSLIGVVPFYNCCPTKMMAKEGNIKPYVVNFFNAPVGTPPLPRVMDYNPGTPLYHTHAWEGGCENRTLGSVRVNLCSVKPNFEFGSTRFGFEPKFRTELAHHYR